ncbi:hypothetical protein PV08_09382 [Exophiala spinifera]|uniref:Chromatin assembly factor 1 subunit A n=1 Tax=Exophiala spinifera TaxID=91928 RepID=A0A0D2AZI0_9EURO|nr:uncharacterized protein PV08_09382 [Exophiala spinifera]KIW12108.1 hypothetical protein PV08_09382 [Exophiala spinifera]
MEPQTSAMSCVPSHPPQQLTPSKKRNYVGEFVHDPSSITPPLDFQSTPVTRSRSASPALSTASTPLTELGSTPVMSPSKPEMAPSDSKKRKLTFAEREVEKALKRQEKEEKERQKAESKAKKEEERKQKEVEKKRKEEDKKRKEEEKKAKDAVKEEKQRQKDAIKAEKEAEKGRKAAEALKKERSQMRIGAFFGRPVAASTPPDSADDVSMGTRSRRSSIASLDMAPPLIETKAREPANPEFNKWILPFFVSENMELAPFNRFHKSTTEATLPLNQGIKPEKLNTQFRKRRRTARIKPVKAILEVLEEMNDSTDTGSALSGYRDPFATIPTKYLYFHQDVRPAYQGTYTRVVSPRTSRKIAVNPAHRGLPNTDYDYDSEAEWQEPEEGDVDLMDEDEKSEDEDADEEMDDFLDDENDMLKRQTVSELEPKSSGLCWEGTNTSPQEGFDLSVYRIDVLHDSTTFPIDPFSTKHWSDTGRPSPAKREKTQTTNTQTPMQPPRLPLMTVDPNSGSLTLTSVQSDDMHEQAGKKSTQAKAKSVKPVKLIDTNLLPAFKNAVSGSTLTKIGLVEVLKQQFPKCAKDAIKNTLECIATRQGTKEAEKKWVLTE